MRQKLSVEIRCSYLSDITRYFDCKCGWCCEQRFQLLGWFDGGQGLLSVDRAKQTYSFKVGIQI